MTCLFTQRYRTQINRAFCLKSALLNNTRQYTTGIFVTRYRVKTRTMQRALTRGATTFMKDVFINYILIKKNIK